MFQSTLPVFLRIGGAQGILSMVRCRRRPGGAFRVIFALYAAGKPITPFRLNDFRQAKSNQDRQIQVRTSCVGYSDYGG
jgi:hypothetical protein